MKNLTIAMLISLTACALPTAGTEPETDNAVPNDTAPHFVAKDDTTRKVQVVDISDDFKVPTAPYDPTPADICYVDFAFPLLDTNPASQVKNCKEVCLYLNNKKTAADACPDDAQDPAALDDWCIFQASTSRYEPNLCIMKGAKQ